MDWSAGTMLGSPCELGMASLIRGLYRARSLRLGLRLLQRRGILEIDHFISSKFLAVRPP